MPYLNILEIRVWVIYHEYTAKHVYLKCHCKTNQLVLPDTMNACNRNRMHIKGDYVSWNRAVTTSFMDAVRAKYMGVAVNGVSRLFMFFIFICVYDAGVITNGMFHPNYQWEIIVLVKIRLGFTYTICHGFDTDIRIWFYYCPPAKLEGHIGIYLSVLVSGLSVRPPHVKFPCIFRRPDYETSNVVDTVIMKLSSLEELCSLNFCFSRLVGEQFLRI